MSVISDTSGLPLYFTPIIFVNLPEIVPVVLVGGYYTPTHSSRYIPDCFLCIKLTCQI